MSQLCFAFINLPDAWRVGFNPVVTYDNSATSGNQWNVPVKFQLGIEYSVVSQNDFGKRFLIKLNVIPAIQGLVKNPIFGGS